MEGAYFACVNANGGVNGHPIKLYKLTEPTQPAQIAADATQLVQTDKVVGESGNSSILECTINHAYWEKNHYYVIAAGIAPECYSTPNIADVNMGPRYSSDGAVQYVLTPASEQDRVRPVERAGHGLHRRGPGGAGEERRTCRSRS